MNLKSILKGKRVALAAAVLFAAFNIHSAAVLDVSMNAAPAALGVTQLITVYMTVSNTGDVDATGVSPGAGSPDVAGTGLVSLASGPEPLNALITAGTYEVFTWTYVADGAGSVHFDDNACGTDALSLLDVCGTYAAGNWVEIFPPTAVPTSTSQTPTPSATQTITATATQTYPAVNTSTVTPTFTASPELTLTAAATFAIPPSQTATPTATRTSTPSATMTPAGPLPSATMTQTFTEPAGTATGDTTVEIFSNVINPDKEEQTSLRVYFSGGTKRVIIRIFNRNGVMVEELQNTDLPPGMHQFRWKGSSASEGKAVSGIYNAVIMIGTEKFTEKIAVVR